jgi:Sec-independent protein secretion pathway component TatC
MTGASETTVPTPRKGISALAVLSLVASFGVCPVVTVLSIPLGFLGLRDVRINNRRGRTLAWIGIVLGVVITPLTTWFMIWWNVEVRIPLKHGPYG